MSQGIENYNYMLSVFLSTGYLRQRNNPQLCEIEKCQIEIQENSFWQLPLAQTQVNLLE